MSLLTGNANTVAAKQARVRARIEAHIARLWADLQIRQQDGMDDFWNNPDGLTPQQVADAFGTDAKKLFDFNAALVNFLVAQGMADGVAPTIRLPKFEYTVNPDGTVTIGAGPYVPS